MAKVSMVLILRGVGRPNPQHNKERYTMPTIILTNEEFAAMQSDLEAGKKRMDERQKENASFIAKITAFCDHLDQWRDSGTFSIGAPTSQSDQFIIRGPAGFGKSSFSSGPYSNPAAGRSSRTPDLNSYLSYMLQFTNDESSAQEVAFKACMERHQNTHDIFSALSVCMREHQALFGGPGVASPAGNGAGAPSNTDTDAGSAQARPGV